MHVERFAPTLGRRGSVLILIAGVIAMIAALSAAFLVRMRQDAEESGLNVQIAQCRLMLHAGMQFIQESARLGYATPTSRAVEAWGWIDVRDGGIGPKGNDGNPLFTPGQWPAVGTVKRAPMFMVERPPFAVVPHMYPNRIPDALDPEVDPDYRDRFGIPLLARPDPLPALDPALGAHDPSSSAQFLAWEAGNLKPVGASLGLAWFRVYRENGSEVGRTAAHGAVGSTFLITVGAGGSQGFKDWGEVVAAGETAAFGDDPGTFDTLLAAELRQWFRVQWSAAVGGAELRNYQPLDDHLKHFSNAYHARTPVNASRYRNTGNGTIVTSAEPRNYVGTITYIQRLNGPPGDGRW